jgi:hypothetical protein
MLCGVVGGVQLGGVPPLVHVGGGVVVVHELVPVQV